MMSAWKKTIALLLCLLLLAGYQVVALERKHTEKYQALRAQADSLQAQVDYDAKLLNALSGQDTASSVATPYRDGTYQAAAQGYGGLVTVKITIAQGKITDIQIVSAPKEDVAYLKTARRIIDDIQAQQTPEVDTISGATMTSTGIKNACIIALNEALNEE